MSAHQETSPGQSDRIELVQWDSFGPEFNDGVASFAIKDPGKEPTTKNLICIGYQFQGGEMYATSNWSYAHTHYYDYDAHPGQEDEYEPIPVSREAVDLILGENHTNTDELLAQYCLKLKPN